MHSTGRDTTGLDPAASKSRAAGWAEFVITNTRLVRPPLVPEIVLHLAEQSLPIWQRTEEELGAANVPPPYWAFAWAGGQALARYVLDHAEVVAGRTVADFGSGCGLAAIAARLAGARAVAAADIDPLAQAAIALNAAANSTIIEVTGDDLAAAVPNWPDVVLIGDMFYERELAQWTLDRIEAAVASGAMILIGDPGRTYFPRARFEQLAEYRVPVSRELEDSEIKHTGVWRPVRPQPQ
jgi:predicted nicotinamide N-methyase